MVQKVANKGSASRRATAPRRVKVPEVDQNHLQHLLLKYVREVGPDESFQLYEYHGLTKQMAANGEAILKCMPLCEALLQAAPSGSVKFTALQQAIRSCSWSCRPWSDALRQRFKGKTLDEVIAQLSDNVITLLKHLRRLRKEDRFRQATQKMQSWQIKQLGRLKDMLSNDSDSEGDQGPTLPTVESKEDVEDDLPSTQDLLRMVDDAAEVRTPSPPKKQSCASSSASSSGAQENPEKAKQSDARRLCSLLAEAQATSPVPCKKAEIYAKMEELDAASDGAPGSRPQVMKRPAAKSELERVIKAAAKRKIEPASSASAEQPTLHSVFEKGTLKLMKYPTGAVAVRMKYGCQKQLLQIKMPTLDESWQKAEALMADLEGGKTLEAVLAKKKAIVKASG